MSQRRLPHSIGAGVGLLTAGLLLAASAADLAGVLLDAPAVWMAGAHLGFVAVCAGVVAVPARLAGSGGRRRWRALLWILALVLFGLTRWVRGHVAIPPDPAVLLLEPIATTLFLMGEVLHRRVVRA